MTNHTMLRMVARGDALDVSPYKDNTVAANGKPTYTLPEGFYQDGLDYCDKVLELWVWSIGRHKETGAVVAALDDRFYRCEDSGYECIWLR